MAAACRAVALCEGGSSAPESEFDVGRWMFSACSRRLSELDVQRLLAKTFGVRRFLFPGTPFRLSLRERIEWRGSHDMAGKAARAAVEAAGGGEIPMR